MISQLFTLSTISFATGLFLMKKAVHFSRDDKLIGFFFSLVNFSINILIRPDLRTDHRKYVESVMHSSVFTGVRPSDTFCIV